MKQTAPKLTLFSTVEGGEPIILKELEKKCKNEEIQKYILYHCKSNVV